MAGISVRNLDDDVAAELKARAARHGRSMEAEVRAILTATVHDTRDGRNIAQAVCERFAPLGDIELEIPARSDPPRSPDLSSAS